MGTTSGFLFAFATIAAVLLGVCLLAWYGQRAAFKPPSQRTLRRLAYGLGAFGFFELGYATAMVVLGAAIPWIAVVQAPFLITLAATILRDQRLREDLQSDELERRLES